MSVSRKSIASPEPCLPSWGNQECSLLGLRSSAQKSENNASIYKPSYKYYMSSANQAEDATQFLRMLQH